MALQAVLPLKARARNRTQKALLAFLARVLSPAKPVIANLLSIPFTVAGIGCVDVGVFTASVIAGWIVTGFSLVLLEHLIADEAR